MAQSKPVSQQQGEVQIDLLDIGKKLLRRWRVFAVVLPICAVYGWYQGKKAVDEYEATTTLLINENASFNNLGESQYLKGGVKLLNQLENIPNEIALLQSYDMVKRAIESLNFDVSYYKKERFRSVEIYGGRLPFVVNLNYARLQLIGKHMHVKLISNQEYELSIEKAEETYRYNFDTKEEVLRKSEYSFVPQRFKFGEEVSNDFFTFSLVKDSAFEVTEKSREQEYSFVINTIEGLTSRYRKALAVKHVDDKGSVLQLSVEDYSPKKAVDFLNAVTSAYINSKLEEKNAFASGTIDFIDNQLSLVSDSLRKAERSLEGVRIAEGSLDLNSKASQALLIQRELEDDLAELEVTYNYYRDILAQLSDTSQLSTVVAPQSIGVNNPLLNNLVTDLNALYTEKASKRFTFSEGSIDMSILNRKIEDKRRAVIQNLQSVIKSVEYSLNQTRSRLGSTAAEIRRLPSSESRRVNIQRKVQLTDNLYNYLMQRRYEAGIAKAANRSDSRVIDQARPVSSRPTGPNRIVILMTYVMLGLMLPAALFVGMDLMDNKVKTEESFAKMTDMPVLGQIPLQTEHTEVFDPDYLMTPLAEAYRYLRVNLDYVMPLEVNTPVIGVTSMVQGEGKTFTSTHLSAVMALSGKSTVIIEADIRRPTLAHRLGIDTEIGLCNYLIGRAELSEIVRKTKINNLSVVPAGVPPPNPSETLMSPRFEELIGELKKRFDTIIIDTAPVGLVSDYLNLNRFVHVTLFVLRQNYSLFDFVREAQKLKDDKRVNHPYFVLNAMKYFSTSYRKSRYGQRYSYHYQNGKYGSNGEAKGLRKYLPKALQGIQLPSTDIFNKLKLPSSK